MIEIRGFCHNEFPNGLVHSNFVGIQLGRIGHPFAPIAILSVRGTVRCASARSRHRLTLRAVSSLVFSMLDPSESESINSVLSRSSMFGSEAASSALLVFVKSREMVPLRPLANDNLGAGAGLALADAGVDAVP